MAVIETPSTIPGGVTPVCSQCGIHLCWDISENEYLEAKPFWDDWACKQCSPRQLSLKQWMKENAL